MEPVIQKYLTALETKDFEALQNYLQKAATTVIRIMAHPNTISFIWKSHFHVFPE